MGRTSTVNLMEGQGGVSNCHFAARLGSSAGCLRTCAYVANRQGWMLRKGGSVPLSITRKKVFANRSFPLGLPVFVLNIWTSSTALGGIALDRDGLP